MQQLYRKFVRAPFAYLDIYFRLLANPATKRRFSVLWGYWKILLLSKLTPNRTKPVSVLGWRVHYGSLYFLRHLYREIFIERLYARHQPPHAKKIIDAGANIGIATLWYKYQYPDAAVHCFEPDPRTFEILQKNIEDNQLGGVFAENVAVSDKTGTLTFHYDESLRAGDAAHSIDSEFRQSLADNPKLAKRQVPAVPLAKYLDGPVDILKVDIEGSEVPALQACADQLKQVKLIQLEYHYLPKKTLAELLQILEGAGHRYRIYLDGPLENKLGRVAMVYSTNQPELIE